MIKEGDQHYSDKGGHFLRGQYWKARYQLEGMFLYDCRAMISVPIPSETTWSRRRFMPRHGIYDGKR